MHDGGLYWGFGGEGRRGCAGLASDGWEKGGDERDDDRVGRRE